MSFDPDRLRSLRFDPSEQRYTARDAILYALGVGMPFAAGDAPDLAFLTERDLKVLPSFAVTLGSPGMWVRAPELGIDWVRLLHAAQAARFHAPLPPEAEIGASARIAELWDRGADKGAVCVVERQIFDAISGRHYATVRQTLVLRGNGGWGGAPDPRPVAEPLPQRAPDLDTTVPLSARAALIYRLSGDLNPLHVDHAVARAAGFERPILHGLASYGTAAALVVLGFCDADPARLAALSLRFAGVVHPSDALRFRAWREGARIRFEAHVGERCVLDRGEATLT